MGHVSNVYSAHLSSNPLDMHVVCAFCCDGCRRGLTRLAGAEGMLECYAELTLGLSELVSIAGYL